LKREQNPNYYDLIKLFYDKTGVPILLNTSFNLKGFPIVETLEDAILTLEKSDIKYLYKP
jgi:carbamoyltransferase